MENQQDNQQNPQNEIQQETQSQKEKDYLLPASIVIAALLIAGAWIYTAGLKANPTTEKQPIAKNAPNIDIENIKAVNQDDHIRGNIDTPIKIVEFSDMECPFCKRFHETMRQVINEYDDKVAWVYRHFPLEQLHPQARKAALASECATEIGGNNAFWNYLDQYMNLETASDSSFAQIAENIGLGRSQFENCLNSGKFEEKIDSYIQDAVNSGAQGTPYSIIINKNGKKTTINGALPFEDFDDQYGKTQKGVKSLIEEALGN